MSSEQVVGDLNQPIGIECWSAEQIQEAQAAAAKAAGLKG